MSSWGWRIGDAVSLAGVPKHKLLDADRGEGDAVSLTDLADLTNVFVDPSAYADEERFHAACRVLRRERPVVRVESERYRPFWAITRHADVLDVERDHEHFRNAPRPLLAPAAMEAPAEPN